MTHLEVEHITLQDGKTMVYRLRGALGETTYAYDFLDELRRQVREGPDRIVLNLEHVEYLSSPGVGVVAAACTSAMRAGKTFALAAVPRHARRVLELAGIWTILEHHETEDDAIQGTA